MTDLQVRDWYVESSKELRSFKPIRDADSELKFTDLLKHIYHRHRYVLCSGRKQLCCCNADLLHVNAASGRAKLAIHWISSPLHLYSMAI